jgi:hypothetical protein
VQTVAQAGPPEPPAADDDVLEGVVVSGADQPRPSSTTG